MRSPSEGSLRRTSRELPTTGTSWCSVLPWPGVTTAVDVLDREMYSEAEAARLLRVAQGTLHYWLEGGTQRGRTYKPILRVGARGDRSVNWAEFVKAALLREYRRTHRVPMVELRQFIDLLREHYGVPYPLAHHQPFVRGHQLVYEAQEASGVSHVGPTVRRPLLL
jgi:hypothetical protein